MSKELDECPPGLIYSSDENDGIYRIKKGRGFSYVDHNKNVINNKSMLGHIESLVIPPAWDQVWICRKKNGHLQVTGLDEKGRKQYMYHPEWTEFRQKNKYNKLAEFGSKLPEIRKATESHLKMKKWPKQKVLALIVSMLDELYIRIGNQQYVEENETFGLTTLRRRHLIKENGSLMLKFKAKSGQESSIKIENKKLGKLVRKISELPGYEIFQYVDSKGGKHPVYSTDVNAYLEEISGVRYTAKEFRTWGGTLLALDKFESAVLEVEENPRKKLETTIVKKVAQELRNTVSVCRQYYIHPKIMEVLLNKQLEKYSKRKLTGVKYKTRLSKNEQLILKILKPD